LKSSFNEIQIIRNRRSHLSLTGVNKAGVNLRQFPGGDGTKGNAPPALYGGGLSVSLLGKEMDRHTDCSKCWRILRQAFPGKMSCTKGSISEQSVALQRAYCWFK